MSREKSRPFSTYVGVTPVVLNRSDYDFHGYHGWDFMRVDPRLESAGASYQDLINKAHAKGIKIFQDVVYNHSSRWGAKDLFTPTVYGVRDEQWKWMYSEKRSGAEYDPMVEHQGNDPNMTAAQNARTTAGTSHGSGGMRTKLEAARIAVGAGCRMCIASGHVARPRLP